VHNDHTKRGVKPHKQATLTKEPLQAVLATSNDSPCGKRDAPPPLWLGQRRAAAIGDCPGDDGEPEKSRLARLPLRARAVEDEPGREGHASLSRSLGNSLRSKARMTFRQAAYRIPCSDVLVQCSHAAQVRNIEPDRIAARFLGRHRFK